ncbi:unnamed protein product, partial [Urochloa humidicola]
PVSAPASHSWGPHDRRRGGRAGAPGGAAAWRSKGGRIELTGGARARARLLLRAGPSLSPLLSLSSPAAGRRSRGRRSSLPLPARLGESRAELGWRTSRRGAHGWPLPPSIRAGARPVSSSPSPRRSSPGRPTADLAGPPRGGPQSARPAASRLLRPVHAAPSPPASSLPRSPPAAPAPGLYSELLIISFISSCMAMLMDLLMESLSGIFQKKYTKMKKQCDCVLRLY